LHRVFSTKKQGYLSLLQLVKKVLLDFFDKLPTKLQNQYLQYYFAILIAAAGY